MLTHILQQAAPSTIPDTGAYFWLGLVVVIGLLLVFVASLVIRTRSLKADLKALEQVNDGR
jgi:ABC-type transport system involved in multi-copper enzyme maturation permease subunit